MKNHIIPNDAKPIQALNGIYFITKEGEIYSKVRSGGGGRIKCCIKNGYKYITASLNRKAKSYYLHRALAETFIPNPHNFPIIDHIDRNRQNNNLTNLRWCDYTLNAINKGGMTGCVSIVKKKGKDKVYCYFKATYGDKYIGCFKTKENAQAELDKYRIANAESYMNEKINKWKETFCNIVNDNTH